MNGDLGGKETPLYKNHLNLGAKMSVFAGYLLPLQYSGIIPEHMAVRKSAGFFDVSHMGEFFLDGADASTNLNRLFSNDFTNMKEGRVRYTLLCNDDGGIVDDLLVYKISDRRFLLVVNASNREKDKAHIKKHLFGDVTFDDGSDEISLLAVQGPKTKELLGKISILSAMPEKYYTFADDIEVAGVRCLVSRTGYTGEFGYEIYCKNSDAPNVWNALVEASADIGAVPCGLGARDTLRLEAAMPLYGHEMDENVSPYETGLGFAVKPEKDFFLGKQAIIERGQPKIARVGLKVVGRGIARESHFVFFGEEKIGRVTSGTYLPYLGGAYAMALVDRRYSDLGRSLTVEVRGVKIPCEVTSLPFYKAVL